MKNDITKRIIDAGLSSQWRSINEGAHFEMDISGPGGNVLATIEVPNKCRQDEKGCAEMYSKVDEVIRTAGANQKLALA